MLKSGIELVFRLNIFYPKIYHWGMNENIFIVCKCEIFLLISNTLKKKFALLYLE